MKVLNKIHDIEKTDASITFIWDNRSASPLGNKDTQIEIVRAEKKDTDSVSTKHQIPVTGVNKSIITPQKDSSD